MSCEKKLQNLIYDNFLVYFKTHIYHVNVEGENFHQYHELLSEVYEMLYGWHDTLMEDLRQMDVLVQKDLAKFVSESIIDSKSDDKFEEVLSNLESLIKSAQVLYEEAGEERHGALETSVGDYMVDVNKLAWKIRSCLK